jgi:hypothetical protein
VKVRRSKVWGAGLVPSAFSDLPRCPTDRYVPFHAFRSPSRKSYFLARVRLKLWTPFLSLSFTCDVISGAEARHRHFSFGLGVWMYQARRHITSQLITPVPTPSNKPQVSHPDIIMSQIKSQNQSDFGSSKCKTPTNMTSV